MDTKKKIYPHSGHRHRIIAKIETQTLCDHELLEILLFNGLPRQNTNELAHRLLAEFGSFDGVMNATVPALQKVKGIGESLAGYIRVVGLIAKKWLDDQLNETMPKKFSYDAFMSYLKRAYKNLQTEVLDAYLLGDAGEILAKKRFSSSMYGKVEMEAPQLIQMLYTQNPAGIVLVHNHPSGEALPSSLDDFTTAYCQKICEENGVLFCDHLIYAQAGVYSYYLNGKMTALSALYEEKYKSWMREFMKDEHH